MRPSRLSFRTALKFVLSSLALVLGMVLLVPSAFALFTNGDFDSGNISGWTKTTFRNNGLKNGNVAATPPITGLNIVRTVGGRDLVTVVGTAGGGPLSIADPIAGAGLMVPRFGDYAVRVNSTDADHGASNNANTLKQQTTVVAGDVDPADGKVHVRFVFAPVLENPAHTADQQPFFYIGVKNITKGNALLYENFNFSGQAGVPWQNITVAGSAWQYTNWQMVDIAPGNGSIDVGDTIEMEIIAAGCAAGGHGGYVYVDSFGAFLPGLAVVNNAPPTVIAGQNLTYNISYRNNDAVGYNNTVVTFNTPPQTTFSSVNDAACSQAGGLVTCNFGTLAAGASGTFQVVVTVAGGATGNITSGDYSISATGFSKLLGGAINTSVSTTATNANLTNLATSIGSLLPGFNPNGLSYQVNVANNVTSISVTPTLEEPTASVTVNGTAVTSGNASGLINLNVGLNPINVVVTSANGTIIKTYVITVNRTGSSDGTLSAMTVSDGTLSPAFDATTTSYTVDVPNSVTTYTVTPTVNDPTATVAIVPANPSALVVGPNTITVTVTAQDGSHKVYTVIVTRAANSNLSSMTVSDGALSPAFDATTTSYTVDVPNSVTTYTVTPTVTDPAATVAIVPANPSALVVGPNTITVTVTAADGSHKVYTVIVTRAAAAGSTDLEVAQSFQMASLTKLTLTITVSNKGPNAVTGATITDTFPEPASGKVWSWTCVGTGGGACGAASGTGNLNEVLGALPVNGTVVFTVTGALSDWSHWTNTATVASAVGSTDNVTTNNTSVTGSYQLLLPIVYR